MGGKEDGHVIFAGRKVAMEKPRVRYYDGDGELELRRWNAFSHPARMGQSVADRILRRVSCRDYAGAIDDVCDGFGIDKSSVSRQWQAAEKIEKDCDRNLWLDAEEAIKYGLADKVLQKAPEIVKTATGNKED
jgi:hypothetical protein